MSQMRVNIRSMLAGILVLVFLLSTSGTVSAGIFGIENYPGGKLIQVFSFQEPDSEAPPRQYRVEITPSGEGFDVTEKVESPGRDREDVSTAFGPSGAAGGANARYEEDDGANIDLSPISVIDDRNLAIKPNQNYLLPDGARLRTGEEKQIAGIDVVIGTFIHPNFSNQRARIGFASKELRDILVFPPFLEIEEEGEVTIRVELTTFEYTQ